MCPLSFGMLNKKAINCNKLIAFLLGMQATPHAIAD